MKDLTSLSESLFVLGIPQKKFRGIFLSVGFTNYPILVNAGLFEGKRVVE